MDIYRRFIQPRASEPGLLLVGRCFTILMIALSFCWLLVIQTQQDSGIYLFTQNIQTHLAPSLTVVATLGMLIPRVNGQGALAGILSGVGLGSLHYVINSLLQNSCNGSKNSWGSALICLDFNKFTFLIALLSAMITQWRIRMLKVMCFQ